jgi:hypothetical protein
MSMMEKKSFNAFKPERWRDIRTKAIQVSYFNYYHLYITGPVIQYNAVSSITVKYVMIIGTILSHFAMSWRPSLLSKMV